VKLAYTISWLSETLVKRRIVFAIIGVLTIVSLAGGIARVKFSGDIYTLFSDTDPHYITFKALKEHFPEIDNLLVYVIDFGEESAFENKNLGIIRALTKDVSSIPFSTRVQSITNVPYFHSRENIILLDDISANSTSTEIDKSRERLSIALSNPLIVGQLLSRDGHVSAIFSQINWPPEYSIKEQKLVNDTARQIQQSVQDTHPNLSVYLIGDVPLQDGLYDAAIRSLTELYPVIMILGAMILWFYFRSILLILSGLIVIFASTVFTVEISGWLSITFDQVSILAVVLVFIIAMADMVHVNSNFLEFLRQGDDRLTAMKRSLEMNITPIFLTSLTTAIGFLGLNSSSSPPIVTLGNLTAIGIISAFFFTLMLLPAIVLLSANYKAIHKTPLNAWMAGITTLATRNPNKIIVGTIVIGLLTITFIPLNRIHDDPIDYLSKQHPVRKGFDFSGERLSSRQQIIFAFETIKGSNINEPEFLNGIEEFSAWLSIQEEVDRLVSYTDVIRLFAQAGDNNTPVGLINFMSSRGWVARLNVFTRPLKSNQLLFFEQRCKQWLNQHLNPVKVIHSSVEILFAHLSQDVVKSIIKGSIISLVLISLTLLVGIQSIKYGFLSLLPNAFPAAAVYGVWGLLWGEVNMAITITFSMSLGIIVDDTVHILSRYCRAIKNGQDARSAITDTLVSTGPALVITSAIIVSGLLVLSLSDFGVHSTIGLVTAPIILLALIFDFLFFPALLIKMDGAQD